MKNLFNLFVFTIEVNLIKSEHIIVDQKNSNSDGIVIINDTEEYELETNQISKMEDIEVEFKGVTRNFAKLTDGEGNEFLLSESLGEVHDLLKLAIIEADWDQEISDLCDGLVEDEEELEEDLEINNEDGNVTEMKSAA